MRRIDKQRRRLTRLNAMPLYKMYDPNDFKVQCDGYGTKRGESQVVIIKYISKFNFMRLVIWNSLAN